MKKCRFRQDIRKQLYWEGGEALDKLSREALETPSLEVFKARLNGALNNAV